MFGKLIKEVEAIDYGLIASLPPKKRICLYNNTIIEVCTIIKSISSKIVFFKWAALITITMEGIILTMKALCSNETEI